MSRSKFEDWAEGEGYNIERDEIGYVYSETIDARRGWLAGRESMRDEAANIANKNGDKCASEIESIEP